MLARLNQVDCGRTARRPVRSDKRKEEKCLRSCSINRWECNRRRGLCATWQPDQHAKTGFRYTSLEVCGWAVGSSCKLGFDLELHTFARVLNGYICMKTGVSEDSDYTSDVNYPVGQHPNSSASQFLSAAHQLATPQRSLNSSRENSYEKDDDYRNNSQSSYLPPPSSQHRHRQLPKTHGLSSSQTQFLTAQSQSHQLHAPRSRHHQQQQYWDDGRESETDPLYYNSRPQSYKPHSTYRRHDSWNDGYSSYRKEDSYSRQYSDDYEEAQDYSQPAHNYAKRLKNNRRKTHSLERQDTLYHDDGQGDYHQDVLESNSRLYDNDRFSSTSYSYNDYYPNAQKDSVYDQYSQDYGDYGQDASYYGNDQATVPQAATSSRIDQYDEDNRYSYDNQDWSRKGGSRDHYSSKPYKELPQIPPQKQPSITKEEFPSDPQDYDTSYAGVTTMDDSFYDDQNYSTASTTTLKPQVAPVTAVPTVITQQPPQNTLQQSQSQSYEVESSNTYENQTSYENNWDYSGYYDETGNYIPYDPNSYYDESGNLVTCDPAEQQQDYSYYDDGTAQSTYSKTPAAPDPTSQTQRADTAGVAQMQSQHSEEQYDNMDYYYSGADQEEYDYDYYGYPAEDEKAQDVYEGDYSQDNTTGFTEKSSAVPTAVADQYTKPSQQSIKKTPLQSLQSQSSVEYNYAYQSAENLSSSLPYDDGASRAPTITTTTSTIVASEVERANSISRRASFRRQTSTRDYGLEGGPTTHSQSFDAPHPSEVPKTKPGEITQTFKNGIKVTVQESIDMGYSMSMEDEHYIPGQDNYDNWNHTYDHAPEDIYPERQPHPIREDSYDQYDPEVINEGGQESNAAGPVHMDSLESNTSEQGSRDPDEFEAQYWQKQKERIAKQATLTAQDSFSYDSYGMAKSSAPPFFEPVDLINAPNLAKNSVISNVIEGDAILSRRQSQEEWISSGSKKNSLELEREEWMSGLDRTGSQRSIKKDIGGINANIMNRQDSIALDSHPEEDEEYLLEHEEEDERAQRLLRKTSAELAGITSPTSKLAMLNEIQDDTMISLLDDGGERKSSLDVPTGKEKPLKSVSFDEEGPKVMIPERQTKGMTPREKWLWSMNRICSQLAVTVPFYHF
ncbi:unnamed protein product [Allacma fusca]|uniref:Uncharacterized protein n=1 Tax=Allacma fusca TaxID=39272 RepID=A0A8J2KWC7_9HEXA|nr:unnamed protein product [Allacma fusca]